MNTKAIESEKALIGCILHNPEVYYSCVSEIKSEDFSNTFHREVWEIIEILYEKDLKPDIATILSEFKDPKNYVDTLLNYMDFTPISSHYKSYLNQIVDASIRRKIINCGQEIIKIGNEDGLVKDIVSKSVEIILDNKISNSAPFSMESCEEEFLKRSKKNDIFSIQLGNEELDELTDGIKPGMLWVINAYSGCGKTTISMQIARNAARQNKKVVFYSLEMRDYEVYGILRRIQKHKKGELNEIKNWDLEILNKKRKIEEIKADIFSRKNKPELIIIDFVQKIQCKFTQIYDRMAYLSDELQNLAHDTDIPIIMLSQVSNEQAKKDDFIPNAKGGGELYAASDVFIDIRTDFKKEREQRTGFFEWCKNGVPGGFGDELWILERKLYLAKNKYGAPFYKTVKYNCQKGKGLYLGF